MWWRSVFKSGDVNFMVVLSALQHRSIAQFRFKKRKRHNIIGSCKKKSTEPFATVGKSTYMKSCLEYI